MFFFHFPIPLLNRAGLLNGAQWHEQNRNMIVADEPRIDIQGTKLIRFHHRADIHALCRYIFVLHDCKDRDMKA